MIAVRLGVAFWLLCAMVHGGVAAAVHTPPVSPTLRLVAPPELSVGQRASLEVTLDLPSRAAEPLLLTAHAEGEALEVVRGRLMRGDARAPATSPMHFDIPVLARSPGTSIVRVHALVYLCDAKQAAECRALELEARASVAVLAR